MPLASSSKTCRTVRIGGVAKSALLDRLAAAQVRINSAGHKLFADERFRTALHPEFVQVQEETVASLGLQHGGVMAEIVAAAARRGLCVCPLEVGPHLRLLLLGQEEAALGFAPTRNRAPPGSITVVSLPLDTDDDTPKGFYLRRIEGRLWLRGYTSHAGHVWQPDDTLVFTRAQGAA